MGVRQRFLEDHAFFEAAFVQRGFLDESAGSVAALGPHEVEFHCEFGRIFQR